MSLTVRNILIVSALTFAAVLGFYQLSVSIANSQPAPSLDEQFHDVAEFVVLVVLSFQH